MRTHPAENTHLYGFIDKTGAEVIEPQYEDAQSFSEGLALVRVDGKGSGYIDTAGTWAIEPRFQNAGDFSEGIAAVWADGGWGYIDKSGAWAIVPRFDEAGPFSEGLAVAGVAVRMPAYAGDDPCLYGYIDTTGAWVIPPRYLRAAPFEGPLAQAWVDGRQGYIDLTGEFVFSQPWEPPAHQK